MSASVLPTSTPVRVLTAKAIYTMNRNQPTAKALAIDGGRILAVGSLDDVTAAVGARPHAIDRTHDNDVVIAGLIDQHLHPLLGATTLATEVIAPEEWQLPTRTFPAVTTPGAYESAIRAAVEGQPSDAVFTTWGFHALWHGPMDRHRLDSLTGTTPVCIWQRSCHEFYINSATIDLLELTPETFADAGTDANRLNLDDGHFWEGGAANLLLPLIAPWLLSEERLRLGLHQLVDYLHRNGVTAINEPGIIWEAEPWDLYEEILGADATPFLSTFLVDARSSQAAKGMASANAVADAARQVATAPEGKVRILDRQIKMFSDGAIISQLMKMRDPYLDANGEPDPNHHGEWMMEPDLYDAYFDAYWDAGWQIHTHVNGDAGLDVVLAALARNMATKPRDDHRSVIVHFANSTEEQVAKIAELGAIVSANPYYPCGFADKYGEFGLGPERADSMVRAASVLASGIPLSFHSDLPMAQAEPLRLAGYGASRLTASGRVARPDQRVSIDAALRAVTIEAAYSWRMEGELGSIEPGKLANLTVLASDPFSTAPEDLHEIAVVATYFEGRHFPIVPAAQAPTVSGAAQAPSVGRAATAAPHLHGSTPEHNVDSGDQTCGPSCGCGLARALAVEAQRLRAA